MWRRTAWALVSEAVAGRGGRAAQTPLALPARAPAPLATVAAPIGATTAPLHTLASRTAGACSTSSPTMRTGRAAGGVAALFSHHRPLSTSRPAASAAAAAPPPQDYYAVLGVPRTATDSDIKRAYYKLAKAYHPDTNKENPAGAASKFQEAGKAYEALRDPDKRAAYDAAGSAQAYESGGGNPFGGGGGGGPFGGAGGPGGPEVEDIFAAFFGGLGGSPGGGRGRASRGGFAWGGGGGGGNPFANMRPAMPDAHIAVRIPFMDAIRGGVRTLNLSDSGSAGGGGGSGGTRSVEVNIPAGVGTGATLRLAGQGPRPPPGYPPNTTPGDLLIEVDVEPHPIFERVGPDILVTAAVPLWDAIAGGAITVRTLDGDKELVIKAGTQPGDRLRMRGYGAPRLGRGGVSSGRGDQYVRVAVRLPKATTAGQLAAVEAVRVAFDGRAGAGGAGASSGEDEKKKAA
jgi:DnaJ-class molecular chaperone